MTPVKKIEQYDLPIEKPVYIDLKQSFDDVITGKNEYFSHWLTKVEI
jgi:hypothetical protein